MQPCHQLSRLLITGHIHEHTPICVLTEIADAHGAKYDKRDCEKPNASYHFIQKINQTLVPSMSEIKAKYEWEYVARFVNRHRQWPQSKLILAYNFLIGFMDNEDPLNKIPLNFTEGLQTPENPYAINACVLYKICVHYRLNMNARTTIKQMVRAINMLKEDIESVTRRAKNFINGNIMRTDLINILMLSPYEIEDPEPVVTNNNINIMMIPEVKTNHDHLSALHGSLNDIHTLQLKIDPTTDSGSVALAAINFNIDISKSTNPSREYKNLRADGRNHYVPIDTWMKFWYDRNPTIFDLSVSFNPLFPQKFYSENNLNKMALDEGYTQRELSNEQPYELLQLAYVAETFYQGEFPNIKSTISPIFLDKMVDIPYGQLLCFGQIETPLRIISMQELIESFNFNQNFTNPFHNDSIFSSTAINKLKIIAKNPSGPIPSKRLSLETIQIREKLYETIMCIETIVKNNDEPTRQFAFAYKNADPDTKYVINETLKHLLHLGMYMRGWNGSSEYPITKAPVPREREPEMALNVTKAIASYESTCRSLGKLGTQINDLPLVKYKDGQYQVSSSSDDGLTVGERISIVKDGDRSNNIASCIRLSSNWLCASAHKYITAIGKPSPFDVFNLRHIS